MKLLFKIFVVFNSNVVMYPLFPATEKHSCPVNEEFAKLFGNDMSIQKFYQTVNHWTKKRQRRHPTRSYGIKEL